MYCKTLALLVALFCVIPASCATMNVVSTLGSTVHRYREVSSVFTPYVNQFKYLASEHHIYFRRNINMGFSMTEGSHVGLTRYENGFREIDIDPQYWYNSNEVQKTILIWHELAHAYCFRMHDFGINQEYGDDTKLADKMQQEGRAGFYDDHCPKSIMFPRVLLEACFRRYYFQYIDEMFENCVPY